MKAMLVGSNKKLLWTDVAEPVMGENDVLVEIHAVALNRADILQKNGSYPSPKGWPEWMGLELAGVITDMGAGAKANSSYQIGDKVCALVGGGGYAEKIAVPYSLLMPIPAGWSFEEASAIPEAYATSYLNLFVEGHLKKGQTFYMAAGASGLASAAIPMGKAAGAYVVTSVQTCEQAEKIKDLGADYIIIQEKESIPEAFEKLEKEGRPVNVCMDCLSGADLGKAMPYMARGGYWVVISVYGARRVLGGYFYPCGYGNEYYASPPFNERLAFGWQYVAEQNQRRKSVRVKLNRKGILSVYGKRRNQAEYLQGIAYRTSGRSARHFRTF